MTSRQTFAIILSALILTACGPGQNAAESRAAGEGGAVASCATRAYSNIGGSIDLVNQNGERVTEADFKGRPTLIYFGFTYCPDICPGTLVAVKNAYDRLPEGVAPPQTVLISVDPERDTPQALAAYVSSKAFPEGLIGLTGTQDQVRAAADAFIADFSRIETPDSLAGYTMDHTSILYLMDKDWTLKTFFAESDIDPEAMAECLAQNLD